MKIVICTFALLCIAVTWVGCHTRGDADRDPATATAALGALDAAASIPDGAAVSRPEDAEAVDAARKDGADGATKGTGWRSEDAIAGLVDSCDWTPEANDESSGGDMVCDQNVFEQSCVPDPCAATNEACRPTCAKSCGGCTKPCVRDCNVCKKACTDDACRRACAETTASCRAKCMTARDACFESKCTPRYAACVARQEAKWNQPGGCAELCPALITCDMACGNITDSSRAEACHGACRRRFAGCSGALATMCLMTGPHPWGD